MPDLVSHAASAFVFRNIFMKLKICQGPYFLMVLFGVFLPDFVSRGSMVIIPEFFIVSQFFHTPLGCFFQTLFISCLFVREQRLRVFTAITFGWILHQVFDAFQITIGPGFYYYFWPLYDRALSLKVFLAEHWMYVALITTLVAVLTHPKTIFWLKIRLGGKQVKSGKNEAE
jgi:hypothetical protein